MEAKMHFARLAQIATVLATFVIGSHANAAPVVYGTYYDESVPLGQCPGMTNNCAAFFSQLPSNQLTKVRRIHCFVRTTQRIVQATLEVSAAPNGANVLSRFVPIPLPASSVTPTSDGVYHTSLDLDTEWLVGQSRFPFVGVGLAAVGGVTLFQCTLIGDLIDPIPNQ
jgi:hypothetical protein